MIKYILSFLLAVNTASAMNSGTRTIQANEIDGVMGFKNLVENSGFERKTRAWTASGGTFTTTTTTADVGSGSRAGSWDSNAADQTLTSTAVSIPAGDFGANYEVSANLKCASGTCTHLIQAFDGTNVIASQAITSSSTYTRTTLNFVAPTSGSISARIRSVASDEPQLFIDDVYLGRARNVGSVAQAELVGTVKIAECSASWNTTSSSYGDFSTVSGCTYTIDGNGIEAPTSNLPGFRLSGPPGKYVIVASGLPLNSVSGTECLYRMTNSSINSLEENYSGYTPNYGQSTVEFSFKIEQPLENSFFRMQTKRISGSGSCYSYGTSTYSTIFKIYRYPLQSEIAYRPETSGMIWSGYHNSDCLWSVTSTSYADYGTDSTCSLIQQNNFNAGTVTTSQSGGNALPGIVFTPKNTGFYEICAITQQYLSSGTNVNAGLRLFDVTGSNTLSENLETISTTNYTGWSLCGIVNYPNLSSKEIRLRGFSASGTMNLGTATSINQAIYWTIKNLSQSLPAPNLVGSVTSLSTDSLRIEGALVAGSTISTNCTSSPCTIYNPTSDWLDSVTRISTGEYQANIKNGVFKSRPVCNLMSIGTGHTIMIDSTSAYNETQFRFVGRNNVDGSNIDTRVSIQCIGQRGSL